MVNDILLAIMGFLIGLLIGMLWAWSDFKQVINKMGGMK